MPDALDFILAEYTDDEGAGKPLWGPWSPDLVDPAERKAQLRSLAAIVYMMRIVGGPDPMPLVNALRRAEPSDPPTNEGIRRANEASALARKHFDGLPTLHQRKIISTFASVNVTKQLQRDIRK